MIGDRIRQARIAAGMTQSNVVDALAEEGVQLTKAGLSKYERGGSTPKATVIRALARVLAVDTSYFLEKRQMDLEWLAFRKKSRLGKRKQERIKALAEAQVEVFLDLLKALEPTSGQTGQPPRTKVERPDQAEKAAEELRKHWRLGEQPIESVTAAIEDGGGIVVETGQDVDQFDGLSGWVNKTVPIIVVSSAVSDDRRRFSLAHELGHLFMRVPEMDSKSEEKLAHRFAASFLVPAAVARREMGDRRRRLHFHELALLKQKYGLSMQAWIMRAADLGIIDQPHARTLFAELSSRGWRRKEPVSFEGQEHPQRLRQLVVRALAEGLLTHSQAERIWPGVTIDLEDDKPIGPLDARSVLRLPKQERARLMSQAADIMADEYEEGGKAGFEALDEEDYLDESS